MITELSEFTIAASLLGAFVVIGIASLIYRAVRESRRDRARERAELTSEHLPLTDAEISYLGEANADLVNRRIDRLNGNRRRTTIHQGDNIARME